MTTQQDDSPLLKGLLESYPQFFDSILAKKDELKVQVIYTQVNRDEKGEPVFTDHYYNVNTDNYYYPASTVKFPVALLALQRLNELKKKGLDKYSTMITETDGDGQTAVGTDPSSADGRPSIAHYIKKILLVSDNDAFNRLYEFLGQEYVNKNLHKMGYNDVQIIHRLAGNWTEEQNRHTNPVRFSDPSGNTVYLKPAQKSKMPYRIKDIKIGRAYMDANDHLVDGPYDFSRKNSMSLTGLHSMLRSVIFPGSVGRKRQFGLTSDDYDFIRRYMSMYPGESASPVYDTAEYPQTFVKKFIYGNEQRQADPGIRIFNKTGTAYGFLTDASYIVDFRNKVEFFLTATIYCNSDGIINDNKYDYDSIGYPFFQQLGRVVYEYELKRERKNLPDLAAFRMEY